MALIAGTLLFAWPAIVNGGPFFFPDTSSYVRGADAAVVSATGWRSQWSDRLVIVATPSEARESPTAAGEGDQLRPTRPVLLNRSVYFGFALYLSLLTLGGLGTVLLMSAITASSIIAIIAAAPIGDWRVRMAATWAIILLIGLVTPLPFFVSRLMPDVFSGILVAALASLILFWGRHGSIARAGLIALCLAAATFHSTHVALAAVTGAAAVWVVRSHRAALKRSVALTLAPLVVAGVGHFLFVAAVEQKLGERPISPPFLSARLIDDGPGYRELLARCPASGWALCQYVERMPRHSDTFLWSVDPAEGVFMAVPREVQRRLGEEDKRFALAVIAHRPGEVVTSSARAAAREAAAIELEHFNYRPEELASYRRSLPAAVFAELQGTLAAREEMPTAPTLVLVSIAIGLALGLLVAAALKGGRAGGAAQRRLMNYAGVLLIAFIANVAICGALSTPHGRYQMGLAWLIPFAAALVLTERAARRRVVISEHVGAAGPNAGRELA